MAIRIQRDHALAPLTTLEVGGSADVYVRAETEGQVVEAIWYAQRAGLALTVLGGGSNSLVADAGVRGVVLQPAVMGRRVRAEGDAVAVEVGAGVPWDELVAWSVSAGLCGLEALSGIPGWVGAAPMQNIGAYGQEVADVVEAVRVVRRDRGDATWLAADQLDFSYRMSAFKGRWRDRFVITAVRFRLRRGAPDPPRYRELMRAVGEGVDHPQVIRDAVLSLRRSKSMVLDDADPNRRSAGSFFLNPILSPVDFERLKGRLSDHDLDPETLPVWLEGSHHKVPAAWLIERAGFQKGFAHGRAALSSRHCLALINPGSATARDLIELAQHVQGQVALQWGVDLEPEPVLVGFAKGLDGV